MRMMTGTLRLRKFLLFLGDIFLLYLSLFLTVFSDFGSHFLPFSILYFLWLIVFYIAGLYDLDIIRRKLGFLPRILWALLVCLFLGIAFFYLLPAFGITPKTNLALNILIFGILFIAWRRIFYSLFLSHLLNKVAIVVKNPQAETLKEEIKKRPYLGYKLEEINSQNPLFEQIKEKNISTLIVPDDIKEDPQLVETLYRCLPAKINFLNWSSAYETICGKIPVSFVAQTWFLENLKEGEKSLYDNIKRVMDVVLAAILLVITSPLAVLAALAIKAEDRGPILYCQKRIGKNKKPFILFKFRSMKIGAEEKTGPVWAEKEDPRVTRIGKFLRSSHLDELPQMINVLKGDISLVGPRPERPEFVEELEKEIPHYNLRHLIKPGFTGWAQIKFRYGRTIMDSKEKFEYDLYYLKNRSPLLDLGILLKTFQLFFKKE